jgi:hypothetical protein
LNFAVLAVKRYNRTMPRALGRLRLRSPPWKLRQLRKLPSSEARRIAANIAKLSELLQK